jgi:hypothetical protein
MYLLASSLAAAALDGHFEHPAGTVFSRASHGDNHVLTRSIAFP